MDSKKVIQKIVVGGVIIKDSQILIVQRNKNEDTYPGLWELPSGKKEDLETTENSLIREVKEETGLNIKPIIPFDVFNYQIDKLDEIKDSTQINYLVQLVDEQNEPQVIISEEHQDYKWVKIDEVDLFNLSDSTKKVIQKAFKLASILIEV
ncbi:MAG: NUDIX hydrolase [Candidatus Shapirobacteria bacterium]|nr:NUDIX hydrolase [Candidatus Shapirobacteria bacterium]